MRVMDAISSAVELQPVVTTLNGVFNQAPFTERCKTMGAAIVKSNRRSVSTTEHHDSFTK